MTRALVVLAALVGLLGLDALVRAPRVASARVVVARPPPPKPAPPQKVRFWARVQRGAAAAEIAPLLLEAGRDSTNLVRKVELYTKVLARAPDHPGALLGLAQAQFGLRDGEACAAAARRALELVPEPRALAGVAKLEPETTLARCELLRKRPEAAEQVLDAALRLPGLPAEQRARLLVLLGTTFVARGFLDEATRRFEQAMAASNDNKFIQLARYHLIVALDRRGDEEAAARHAAELSGNGLPFGIVDMEWPASGDYDYFLGAQWFYKWRNPQKVCTECRQRARMAFQRALMRDPRGLWSDRTRQRLRELGDGNARPEELGLVLPADTPRAPYVAAIQAVQPALAACVAEVSMGGVSITVSLPGRPPAPARAPAPGRPPTPAPAPPPAGRGPRPLPRPVLPDTAPRTMSVSPLSESTGLGGAEACVKQALEAHAWPAPASGRVTLNFTVVR